jgi:hypothetical protein
MIPIIKHREHKSETTYSHDYHWKGQHLHDGFSFPCDKNGNLQELNPAAEANYRMCLISDDLIDNGIVPYTHSWIEDAQARCLCGHTIFLGSFTNTCEKCGRDYNMSGQELAPRRFWGEETGETPDEILNIGHTIS